MSPEQALGQPVDARSDLFSFGVVLYEMAVGRLPFEGATATSVIDKILHATPPAPREMPPAVEDLILKLLEKSPDDRYQASREVVVDLRRLKRASDLGKLTAERPPAAGSRAVRKHALALAAAVALAFVAGLVAHRYWMRGVAGDGAPVPRFSAITRFAGVEAQPSLSPDGRSIVFVSDRGGQRDLWVGLIDGGNLLQITNDRNAETRPRWSPDGSRIAYARLNDGGTFDIWTVPALGGTSRKLLQDASDPAWSPDGRSLAYVNLEVNALWMCDASGGNARALTKPQTGQFPRQPAFSRDGQRIAFEWRRTGPRGELAVSDIRTQRVQRLTNDGMLALTPAWSADDRFLYFASSRSGAMNIWKVASGGGQPRQVTTGQGDDAELDLSRDGKRLVFSTYRVNVDLAELPLDSAADREQSGLQAAEVKWLTRDATRGEMAPAYSPDGKKLVYFSNRRGAEAETMWTMEADGSNAAPLLEDGRVSVYPRWTADGQSVICMSRVGFTNFEIRRIRLSGGQPEALTTGEAFSVPWGDVSADGRVVYGRGDGMAAVLDLKNHQVQELKGVRGSHFRWSRDGRLLAYTVRPRRASDPEVGAWLYDFHSPPRQLFKGWVLWQEWMHSGELLVAQGRGDLTASLWRVRPDGSAPTRSITLPTFYSYYVQTNWLLMFDVHPGGRRIVAPLLESHEADIGMIENVP
jgi:Tol biopolymer transport system component